MTFTPETANGSGPDDAGVDLDVVIIGAGISGIGAAYRITEANPGISYVILDRRDQIGGTWDLFRYPGVRSDSSVFTLSFPWEPWVRKEGVADGDHIHDYLIEAAQKHGIAANIHLHNHVRSANWDSATDTWTVRAEDVRTGAARTFRSRFIFLGSGYYNYDKGYTPDFPGMNSFEGRVIHPQFWPADGDYAGKSVVVIGSGATAISLVPALSNAAASVVMLQRSPTYLFPGMRVNPLFETVRKLLPRKVSHAIVRLLAATLEAVVWLVSRKAPSVAKAFLRSQNARQLPPGYPVDIHFKPRYKPWDQRLCLVADGDLFAAISSGRAEVVTDHIDRFDETGIALRSGRHLDADIIVTATGLRLQALGGITISTDGVTITPQDRFVYKAHMLEDVPNLVWCIGYTNASWTLRADITARATAKLIAHMRSRGYTHAYPHRADNTMHEKPTWDIQAGYVLRDQHALPKSGTRRPWNVRQNYFVDAIDYNLVDKIDEQMVFGGTTSQAQLAG